MGPQNKERRKTKSLTKRRIKMKTGKRRHGKTKKRKRRKRKRRKGKRKRGQGKTRRKRRNCRRKRKRMELNLKGDKLQEVIGAPVEPLESTTHAYSMLSTR